MPQQGAELASLARALLSGLPTALLTSFLEGWPSIPIGSRSGADLTWQMP